MATGRMATARAAIVIFRSLPRRAGERLGRQNHTPPLMSAPHPPPTHPPPRTALALVKGAVRPHPAGVGRREGGATITRVGGLSQADSPSDAPQPRELALKPELAPDFLNPSLRHLPNGSLRFAPRLLAEGTLAVGDAVLLAVHARVSHHVGAVHGGSLGAVGGDGIEVPQGRHLSTRVVRAKVLGSDLDRPHLVDPIEDDPASRGIDLGDLPALAVVDVVGGVVDAGDYPLAAGEGCVADLEPVSIRFASGDLRPIS